jgi:superfamily II DNA or RNA helicase
MQKANPERNVIICVPTDYLRDQWRKHIDEWKMNYVYVDTWHTLINSEHECDLLIVDEIHSNTAPESKKVFTCVKHRWLLGLTGSLREDPEAKAFIETVCPIFDVITLEEAEKNGWVSNFTIYNLGVEFNTKDQATYKKINDKFIKYFSTFDFDFNKAMGALGNDFIIKDIAKKQQWDENLVKIHAVQFGRVMRQRKDYIYHADCVFDAVVKLIKKFTDKKIITFTEKTELADKVTNAFPTISAAYHSQLKTVMIDGKKFGVKRRKDLAMDKFINDDIRILSTAKALNVGADIPGVDMSIIFGFNSSLVDSIQRTGRAVRYAKDKNAIEVNIYIKGTQSEKWLRNKQRKTPNIKWVNSIGEIGV